MSSPAYGTVLKGGPGGRSVVMFIATRYLSGITGWYVLVLIGRWAGTVMTIDPRGGWTAL